MRAKRWVDILFLASILGLIAVSAGVLRPEAPPAAPSVAPAASVEIVSSPTARLTLAAGAEVLAVALTPVNLPASIVVGSVGRETAGSREKPARTDP